MAGFCGWPKSPPPVVEAPNAGAAVEPNPENAGATVDAAGAPKESGLAAAAPKAEPVAAGAPNPVNVDVGAVAAEVAAPKPPKPPNPVFVVPAAGALDAVAAGVPKLKPPPKLMMEQRFQAIEILEVNFLITVTISRLSTATVL